MALKKKERNILLEFFKSVVSSQDEKKIIELIFSSDDTEAIMRKLIGYGDSKKDD